MFVKKWKKKYDGLSRVAKASIWFTICGFLQRGISVITTPIFTRLFETGEYGVYSVFNSWLEIITIFATLRLGRGVYMQGLVKYSDDQDVFSSSVLGLATTWWLAALGIYWIFRETFNKLFGLSTFLMLCMYVMMLSTIAFNFWSAKERNEFRYVKLIWLTLGVSVLKPIMGIIAVCLSTQYKVEARIFSLACVELLMYAGMYIVIMRKGRKFYDAYYWKYALAFNVPLIPHFLSQVILNHSDRIMIKELVGYNEAGIYSLAYSIAVILNMMNTSIQYTLRPWVFQRLKSREEKKIQTTVTGALLIVAGCNLALIAFAPELVHIFAPEAYRGATGLIPPITMGVFFMFLYNLFVDVEMYFGKTKSIMTVAVICAAVNVGLNYVFIRKFGYAAAAYTTLVSYILMALMHYFGMQKVLKQQSEERKVYDVKILVIFSAVFMFLGTVFGLLADYFVLRMMLVLFGGWYAYRKREQFREIFRMMSKKRVNNQT